MEKWGHLGNEYLGERLVEFSSCREGEGRAHLWLGFVGVLRKDNFFLSDGATS